MGYRISITAEELRRIAQDRLRKGHGGPQSGFNRKETRIFIFHEGRTIDVKDLYVSSKGYDQKKG